MNAVEIAPLLDVPVNTVRGDLRAFDQPGLDGLRQSRSVGAPPRIAGAQQAEMRRLAKLPPYELGLPLGRWSVEKLRDDLTKTRVVKRISREHLRRLLKKGASTALKFVSFAFLATSA